MIETLTVIPADRLIAGNGLVLQFDFSAPEALRALQWQGNAGHVEYADGRPNRVLGEDDYAAEVAPFAALWTAEKDRLEAEAAVAEAAYNSLENVRARKIAAIDAATTAAIMAGFEYAIDAGNGPEMLHFSYDGFDQQNFADTANACILALSGTPGLPDSVTWNAYRLWTPENGGDSRTRSEGPAGRARASSAAASFEENGGDSRPRSGARRASPAAASPEKDGELVRLTLGPEDFLALYTGGALAHKAAAMEEGGRRKAAAEAARTVAELEAV